MEENFKYKIDQCVTYVDRGYRISAAVSKRKKVRGLNLYKTVYNGHIWIKETDIVCYWIWDDKKNSYAYFDLRKTSFLKKMVEILNPFKLKQKEVYVCRESIIKY